MSKKELLEMVAELDETTCAALLPAAKKLLIRQRQGLYGEEGWTFYVGPADSVIGEGLKMIGFTEDESMRTILILKERVTQESTAAELGKVCGNGVVFGDGKGVLPKRTFDEIKALFGAEHGARWNMRTGGIELSGCCFTKLHGGADFEYLDEWPIA